MRNTVGHVNNVTSLTSITFSFVDQSSKTFLAQRGRGRSWSTTFSIFDLWIRSGDIRDQSRKLSWKNLDAFLAPPNFRGQAFQKLYPGYNPWLAAVVRIKICDGIPISSELIDVYTLNFKPNFKFSGLKNFGGTPVPVGVCASKAWSISSACKNMRAQHPLRAEI